MVGDYHTADLSTVKMSQLMVGREVEILNREMGHEEENEEVCLEFNHFGL